MTTKGFCKNLGKEVTLRLRKNRKKYMKINELIYRVECVFYR